MKCTMRAHTFVIWPGKPRGDVIIMTQQKNQDIQLHSRQSSLLASAMPLCNGVKNHWLRQSYHCDSQLTPISQCKYVAASAVRHTYIHMERLVYPLRKH